MPPAQTKCQELADIAALGLTRRRRVLESPCGRIAAVDGKKVLNFASNDYLGWPAMPKSPRRWPRGNAMGRRQRRLASGQRPSRAA
jgi:7-keto-8-aminopelargonate synthetase-like enzyme